MFALVSRAAPVMAAAILALAACSDGGSGGGGGNAKIDPVLKDVTLGDAKAPVEVIEYASLTCPHCRDFWKQDFPRLKATYIDTGKVKYTYRDFPTDPDMAVAGVGVTRCKGADNYYALVDEFFTNQYDLAVAARDGKAGPKLVEIGGRHGLTQDEIRTCIDDKRIRDYLNKTIEEGRAKGVDSTPAVFVNGKRVANHEWAYLQKDIEAVLNPGAAPAEAAPTPAAPTTQAPATTPVPATPAPAPATDPKAPKPS
jgi:protein-disulfide isomerase